MEMTSLNISLPESLRAYIESRVQSGDFSTTSDYLWSLVREEQKRHEEAKLENMLLEALNTEGAIEMTPQYWQAKRQNFRARFRFSG
jgi:antitoxin ParD1/3/4